MITEFKFPDVGEGITEGEVVSILVKEGDSVRADQPLFKIETDKAIVDIPSPKDGVILKIHVKEHTSIKVGEVLATIGEKTDKFKAPVVREEIKIKTVERPASVVGELEEAKEPMEMPKHEYSAKSIEKRVLALPSVRKLASQLNVDLIKVKGTGKDNSITEKDVKDFSEGKTSALEEHVEKTEAKVQKKYDFYGYIEHVPVKGVRKAIAKKMVESVSNAAHVTHMDEADVTSLWNIREKEKIKASKKGVHLTFMPFIVKASIECLKKHPFLNSSMENDEIILKKYYNIGIAVDTEDGLIVPVVKRADSKNMLAIAKEIEELANKARKREIDLSDLKGSTFTITNVGSIGGIYATPIINYPEAAILALGKIQDKAVVENGKINVKKILTFSLTFDHRILDGAQAARFAQDLIGYLEDPDVLLVEME
ncbi:MAG TPA: dihydrolipoamide acetyltransferase family protein [Candidatus Nanoarchaeia archaeon]|nr:dihydrolipoamide acetyltransferase family protein [Candidatus Nanoarchaeia archaeon]